MTRPSTDSFISGRSVLKAVDPPVPSAAAAVRSPVTSSSPAEISPGPMVCNWLRALRVGSVVSVDVTLAGALTSAQVKTIFCALPARGVEIAAVTVAGADCASCVVSKVARGTVVSCDNVRRPAGSAESTGGCSFRENVNVGEKLTVVESNLFPDRFLLALVVGVSNSRNPSCPTVGAALKVKPLTLLETWIESFVALT